MRCKSHKTMLIFAVLILVLAQLACEATGSEHEPAEPLPPTSNISPTEVQPLPPTETPTAPPLPTEVPTEAPPQPQGPPVPAWCCESVDTTHDNSHALFSDDVAKRLVKTDALMPMSPIGLCQKRQNNIDQL